MSEQKMSERIAELEQQLAQAEAHHQFHHAQEEQWQVVQRVSLTMQESEQNWRVEALELLDSLGRALHLTTQRLSAHELDIVEAGVPRRIKAVLEQARLFLDELQIAPADELYDWLPQTEDELDRLSDQREGVRTLLETWLAWASTPSKQSDQRLLQVYEETRAFLAQYKE
jgi:hypothetical protein